MHPFKSNSFFLLIQCFFLLLVFSCKEPKKFSARKAPVSGQDPTDTTPGVGDDDATTQTQLEGDEELNRDPSKGKEIDTDKIVEGFIDSLKGDESEEELQDAAEDFIKSNELKDVIDAEDLLEGIKAQIAADNGKEDENEEGDVPKGPEYEKGTIGEKIGLNKTSDGNSVEPIRACGSPGLLEDNATISFSSTRGQKCKYGKSGNLSKKDKHVRARREQYVNAPVDGNRLICSFELSANQANFNYDDNILLSLNNIVLASNMRFMDKLVQDGNGFYSYDWNRLLRTYHDNGFAPKDGKFCIKGTTQCQLPRSEYNQPLKFTMNSSTNKALSNLASQQNSYRFGLVITGDDNTHDCEHSGLNLTMKYKYVLKQ